MDFEQLRRNLRWLRGKDGVVEASVAENVLARVLEPLLLVEGLVITRPLAEGVGFDIEATNRDSRQRKISSIVIQYKHFGRGRPIGVREVRSLIDSGLKGPHPRLMLIGRFGFTKSAVEAARNLDPITVDLLDLNDIDRWITSRQKGSVNKS
jgi:hypothetical protein